MPLLWLRVALICYGIGLIYALATLRSRSETLARWTVPAILLGAVFHLVSLVETFQSAGFAALNTASDTESLLAFLLGVFFLVFYARYRTTAPGVFLFPLIFLLALTASLGKQPVTFQPGLLRSGWIFTHVSLIFLGYAALIFSFVASLMYLLQERNLKAKTLDGGVGSRLPALEVIDEIGYRSLLLGFPFMTVGLILGAVIAHARFGPAYFQDPKVLLSLLMWGVYVVLVYTRWNAAPAR